jgi:hypothetical protein
MTHPSPSPGVKKKANGAELSPNIRHELFRMCELDPTKGECREKQFFIKTLGFGLKQAQNLPKFQDFVYFLR